MAGGSGVQMGIVCCERPPSGIARLEASVGGTLRAVAVVTIGPVAGGGPGHDVEVQDWQLCVTGSCTTTPTTPTGPGP